MNKSMGHADKATSEANAIKSAANAGSSSVATLKGKLKDVSSNVARAEARLAKAKAAAAKKKALIQTKIKTDMRLKKIFTPAKNIGKLESADLKVAHKAFTHEFKEFEHEQRFGHEVAEDTILLSREYSISG